MPENVLFSFRTDLPEDALVDPGQKHFQTDRQVHVNRLWNGRIPATEDQPLIMSVASLWNREALFFYFACSYHQLNVHPEFGNGGPCNELWEFDVVEAFIRPSQAGGYFELEVSPLGQWLDLHVLEPRRKVDWDWRSQLSARTLIQPENSLWLTTLRVPFQPMLDREPKASLPKPGSTWRINLFRAAGLVPSRLYFSWRPTLTLEPDFHVPSAFGNLLFMDEEFLSS